jgi:hypothetical protein
VIVAGFIVALLFTIYLARRTAHLARNEVSPEPEVPTLDIDLGTPSDSLTPRPSEPAILAVDEDRRVEAEAIDPPPASKTPPLLSARSKPTTLDEAGSIPDIRTAAKPVDQKAPAASDQYVSSAPASEASAAEPTEETPDYPSTAPAAYRPGGRVPREARLPNYPRTSTPHLR